VERQGLAGGSWLSLSAEELSQSQQGGLV